jgi:hypothetical protein
MTRQPSLSEQGNPVTAKRIAAIVETAATGLRLTDCARNGAVTPASRAAPMRMCSLALLFLTIPAVSTAQSTLMRAGPPLFVLDLQGTALDEFPAAVKALTGTMTMVDKNGQRMLRASSPSEFLITLPQVLPADFTVEADLIPKSCCNPDDFMLEATPTGNRAWSLPNSLGTGPGDVPGQAPDRDQFATAMMDPLT